MSFWQALIFGMVQGLGEFLPISSSAHLTVLPWLMRWEDPGLAFDVALHVGTLLALVVYFWRELLELARALGASFIERRIGGDPKRRLAWYLVLGSVPGAVLGYLLERRAEESFRDPRLIAVAMLVMGLVLYVVDRAGSQTRRLESLSAQQALWIGLWQAAAIVPGVSRSGATITAGRATALDRQSAAHFSFLLAVPVVAGAALLKVPKLLAAPGTKVPLIIAVASAAVSGYVAIGALLRWVRTQSYLPFVLYRVAFAVVVLAVFYARS